jgi:hypothetical protein
LQQVEVSGFNVTAITWRHREINFLRLLKANFFVSAKFAYTNLFTVPFNAPYFGYYVEGPGGTRLLNYCEGFSNAMKIEELRELGNKFKVDILLAGAQLDFERYVSSGVACLAPKTVVLFHPHEAMFNRIGLKSSEMQVFVKGIKRELPEVKIVVIKPMTYLN